DELHFHFELFDNDIISGPKKTVSGEFVARLPSLADLFETLESQEEDLTQGLDERLEEVRALQEQLQKVELDLVKSEDVDWEQKQAIKKQLERFKKEAEALQEMAETLEKMAELDEKHNLFSDELRKKFDELQNLVSQLINDELMNKLNQLDQNLDSVKLDDLKKAMSELAQNADQIEADLDRFLDLFKRVQAEQKMDEISRRLEAMVKEQSTLDKKIQQTPEDVDPSDRARLSEDERRIRDEWKQTLTAMEEGAEQVRKFSPETAAGLEEMRNSDTAQQAGENLQSTMNQLSDSQMTQASMSSSQALQNLSDLSSQAQQLQTMFQNQTADAMAGKFRSLMRDLLSLSKSQESLLNTTQSTAAHSSRYREQAAQEQVLKDQLLQTMSKLMELSRETFAVTPEMGKALGMAAVQMEGAKQALSERNRNAAMKGQESAMASLNSGARALGSAARQMQQSGSASGFEQFLAQMQSMAGQQQSLNQQGLPLLMGQSGASLRQQLMQRMLAGQQGIRKSLQQLMDEMRSSGNPQTGDMGGMARGMDEVIRDLQAGRYTRKTRTRQEQILSRMLDSQKSLTQRGKKEERKSRTASQVAATGPGGLPTDLGQRRSEVLEALNDALQAGYPADYQVMIRRYFNSLNSQSLPASESTGDSSP
ncbi:MAG: hypothetical protein GXO90_04960, partial [FCB group bacterium]|nr:hypothetical protein [FCB group bacterium]